MGVEVVFSSFIIAFICYILVEGPFTSIIREWFSPDPAEGSKDKDAKNKEDIVINGSPKTNGVSVTDDNSVRKRILNKEVDKSSIYTHEKNR